MQAAGLHAPFAETEKKPGHKRPKNKKTPDPN
jgi:hypothetical protein